MLVISLFPYFFSISFENVALKKISGREEWISKAGNLGQSLFRRQVPPGHVHFSISALSGGNGRDWRLGQGGKISWKEERGMGMRLIMSKETPCFSTVGFGNEVTIFLLRSFKKKPLFRKVSNPKNSSFLCHPFVSFHSFSWCFQISLLMLSPFLQKNVDFFGHNLLQVARYKWNSCSLSLRAEEGGFLFWSAD